MLENISWSSYWAVIVIGLAIYYSILFVVLYKKGLFFKDRVKVITSNVPQRKASIAPQPELFGSPNVSPENHSDRRNSQLPVDDNILMPVVHDLTEELKGFITDIAERSYIKEEVVTGIQLIINSYKKLEGSSYQKSINDFMKSECEEFCSIHLSENDIRRIWIG